MTFLRMLLSQVDPFAVYAAQRELAAHGINMPRERLAVHYLLQGQLRTVVSKLIASPSSARFEEAFAAALAEGPDESANPRFVAPLRMGILYSVVVLIAVAAVGALEVLRLSAATNQVRWDWLLAAAGLLIGLCLTYTFLGAHIGRTKAKRLLSIVVALALVGFIYGLVRYLGP